MWGWVEENSGTIQVIVSIATAIIWIFYLQVFLMSYLRQTRASLLITMAGGKTSRARCIVSNMSSEPAFLVEVIAELEQNGTNLSMSVTDRIGAYSTEGGHRFHAIVGTDSTASWAAIPPLGQPGRLRY